jgi:hypothetical protein
MSSINSCGGKRTLMAVPGAGARRLWGVPKIRKRQKFEPCYFRSSLNRVQARGSTPISFLIPYTLLNTKIPPLIIQLGTEARVYPCRKPE